MSKPARQLGGTIGPRIVRMLDEGPGTPREIADEMGMDVRLCSAHLSNLYRKGFVDREVWMATKTKQEFLYKAKEYGT